MASPSEYFGIVIPFLLSTINSMQSHVIGVDSSLPPTVLVTGATAALVRCRSRTCPARLEGPGPWSYT